MILAARQLTAGSAEEDESHWVDEQEFPHVEQRKAKDHHEDENMEGSGHGSEDDENRSGDEEGDDSKPPDPRPGGAGGTAYDRLARLAGESGIQLDEATAAALFGGEFRAFGGLMSGLSSRFKRLKNELRSPKPATRLKALRECSELLLVSNEDTLGGSFSTSSFAAEFIAILNGKPNIDEKAGDAAESHGPDEVDEDAQLVAALALSTGGSMLAGMPGEDEMECQLVACRCLAHLMEALPGSGHTLVHLGAVPVLCTKLTEISYIELAEQTLSVSRADVFLASDLLYCRQWRRSLLSTPRLSFAKEVSMHCSTTYLSSRLTFSAPPSPPPPTAAAIFRANIFSKSETPFLSYARP